jgi:hypothetical protein
MRSELWLHYKGMQAADPTWRTKASQVWSLTLKMLGKEWNPCVKAKASESRHLVDFAVKMVERHQASLDHDAGRFLLASGRAAIVVNQIIRESPRLMSVSDQQRLFNA